MSSSPLKQYTLEELALGDGKEGRPALIGYKGKVYDCTASKLWKNGKHVNAHHAGHDLTAEMAAAPHMDDVMQRMPLVGELHLDSGQRLHFHEAKGFVAQILARHPHPITAHFPIGLGVVAALFTAITMVLELQAAAGELVLEMRIAAWYMVLSSAVLGIPAILSGLLSWWFNYAGVMNYIYRWKIILSILLVVLAALSILLGWPGAQHLAGGSARYWSYNCVVLLQAPVVVLLGWLGGKVVYP